MPARRLLYITSRQVQAYHWRGGRLEADAIFSNNEDGVAEFGAYVESGRDALYFPLADVVEEDFHAESVPFVRGGDRKVLIERKLAQRYRDVSLALTVSLGYESGGRREERLLFSAFTNTQQFQPWLAALRSREARIVGVYSVPLVAPLVGKRVGFASSKRYLLVGRQQAGLRQTFVDEGRIRFSRLGRVDNEAPRELARACAVESGRIQQFLTNTRVLPRDAGALDVVVLAPAADADEYRRMCVDTQNLRFHIVDLDAACSAAKLKSAPDGLHAERLFLHVLAQVQPAEQFADDALRRFYHLWRARVALYAAGVAVFTFAMLLAGVRMLDVMNVRELAVIDLAEQRRLSDQYSRQQANFPKTPTSVENLKVIVGNFELLQRQTATPEPMFIDISQALAFVPQIEIERIDWQLGQPPSARGGQDGKAPPTKPAPPPAPRVDGKAGERSAADGRVQVVEIAGRINVPQSSDYRNISFIMGQFVENLRRRPGIDVISTRLPFDITAEKSLSGDIGAERATEVPQFTIVISRSLGS